MEDKKGLLKTVLEKKKGCSCYHCGASEAQYVANPYDEDVFGEIDMEYICDGCYHDLCMDI